MKINHLKVCSGHNGRTIVEVWADCHTAEEIDDLIAWLQMAKGVMYKWEKINAKAPRPTQAAPSQDEIAKRRQVQGQP